jgi:serine/threonine-protein kinase RsbW
LCGRPLDEIRPGGLGMHIIQEGVDVVQYATNVHRNRLRLVKYLPAADGDESKDGEGGTR